jgi:hypothetical protein
VESHEEDPRGGETEYAIGATRKDGDAMPQSTLLGLFTDFVRDALPYTSISEHARFLTNGGPLNARQPLLIAPSGHSVPSNNRLTDLPR